MQSSKASLGGTPSGNNRNHIASVTIEHFRSFKRTVTVGLRPGLNILVGENGAGKSNVLDAILFALAHEPSTLNVRGWSELHNSMRAGPCAVRLLISPSSPTSDAVLTVMAHAKEDCTRVFQINGAAATMQQAKEALFENCLDASSSSFVVRQAAAARPIDDASLTALLQEASCASMWSEAAALSQQQLSKELATLGKVHADIAALESMCAKERRAKHALGALLRLSRRERCGQATMVELARCLTSVASRVQGGVLLDARARYSAAQHAEAVLRRACDQARPRLEELRKQAGADVARAAKAAAAAENAGEVAAEAEAELVHAHLLVVGTAAALSAARSDRALVDPSSRVRRLVRCSLKGSLLAARRAEFEAEVVAEETSAVCCSASGALLSLGETLTVPESSLACEGSASGCRCGERRVVCRAHPLSGSGARPGASC